jgi:uncharacterized protein (DUF305 family)
MEELKADFDRYVLVSYEIDAIKNEEIKGLKRIISRQEATIELMERLLNNKGK